MLIYRYLRIIENEITPNYSHAATPMMIPIFIL
jgi:hypothetical protein